MPATKSKIPRPDPDTLRHLYLDEGKSAVDIAAMYERDDKTAWWWLKQAGIPTRPRGSDVRQQFKKGQPSLFAGHKHSSESIEKIRASTIADGRVPYLRNGKHWLAGAAPEENPNWKGGATPERQTFYRSIEWKACVRYVWTRDRACCRNCGKDWKKVDRKVEPTFHIHHVMSFGYRQFRARPEFLVLLCRDCHLWVHSKANVTQAWLPQPISTSWWPTLEELSTAPEIDMDDWRKTHRRARAAYNATMARAAATPTLFDITETEDAA